MGDDIQSKGKYFRITVPDYATDSLLGDTVSSRTLSSYLRLGAVPTVPSSDPPQLVVEPGDDLAKLVHDFVDDTRQRDGSAHHKQAHTVVDDESYTRNNFV